MNTGTGVFVLHDETTLVAIQPTSFATEDDFQRLLAAFPEFLAGDQIDADAPQRFILVAREQGIAFEEGAGERWSLDYLFLDQDGIPTLVEVKRGTDTRLRHEAVGQMPDYAANAVLRWPVETLQAQIAARCEREGWGSETALLTEIAARDPGALGPARTIAAWIRERADRVAFNTNPQWGWMGAALRQDGIEISPLRLHTDATTAVYFEYMLGKPVFDDLGRRQALLDRLNAVPGLRLPPDAVSKRKGIPLARFTPETVAAFLAVMDWFVDELRRA